MAGTMTVGKRSILDKLIPPRAQAVSVTGERGWSDSGGVASAAGQRVNGSTALTFSGCWAATNALAGLFGALPFKPYKKTADGREEATKHESHKILSREPNPEMDSFVFWEMMTQWWINYGNAFAEIQTLQDSDRLYALWPIHPSRVRPERDNQKNWTGRWIIRNNDNSSNTLDKSEVLNIVGHLSDDGLMGKGVLMYAAQCIGVGLAQSKYEGEFYENGARPSGTLEHPKALSEDARAKLRREWKEVHGKSNEVAILFEGMKFNPVSVDPEHAKLMEAKLGTIQDMCRFYDLPPHVLYELSKGTFANTEEMNRFLVSQPLNRRLVRVEKACDRQLFTEAEKKAGYYTKFNLNALLRGTPKEQAEVNAILLANGALNQDEWRAQDERNKLPDGLGENYWMSRNFATIEDVLAMPEPGTAPDPPATPVQPPQPEQPPQANRLRELRSIARKLTSELRSVREAKQTELAQAAAKLEEATNTAALEQTRANHAEAALRVANAVCEDLKSEKTTLECQIGTLNSQLGEVTANHGTTTTERDELGVKLTALEASHLAATEAHAAAVAKATELEASALEAMQAAETASNRAEQAENYLKTANQGLLEANQARETLQASLKRAERSETEINGRLDRAIKRADELTSRCDALAVETGTLRAERDALNTRMHVLEKSRDELAAAITEHQQKAHYADKQAEKAALHAAEVENSSKSALKEHRLAVEDASRQLLDRALDSLFASERKAVVEASRKYEQFKSIIDGYYHNFRDQLAATLRCAATPIELCGGQPIDTAKLAADYVAGSRRRLNAVAHNTPRDDIRPNVHKEIDGWDRKQELINWIGA